MSRILLLGAGGPAGENFTRAVQAAGYEVIGCDTDPHGLELSSAEVRERLTTHVDARTERALRVAEVNRLIDRHQVDAVHAQPDPEAAWLAQNAGHIHPRARALVPHPGTIALCHDKLLTARRVVDAPHSISITEATVDAALAVCGGLAWVRARHGAGARAALAIDDPELGRAWCRYWAARDVRLMAAPVLLGSDLSWTGVWRAGDLIASATKERTALLGASRSPALISSTARVQEIVQRPDAASVARSAVHAVDERPNGVYMVDMREDAHGRPLVTEINAGRFGTTSEFFAQAGGNLPAVWAALCLGDDPPTRGEDVCSVGAVQVRNTDMGSRVLAPELVSA